MLAAFFSAIAFSKGFMGFESCGLAGAGLVTAVVVLMGAAGFVGIDEVGAFLFSGTSFTLGLFSGATVLTGSALAAGFFSNMDVFSCLGFSGSAGLVSSFFGGNSAF